MFYVIGIDPGAKGAWGVIPDNGTPEVFPWDNQEFIKYMQKINNKKNTIKCALEKVGAMPKQGVSSTWKFAEEYGFIKGVLSALGIPYQTVPPQTWKKEFSLLNQDKKKSIEIAQQLFPDVNFMPTERCRKPSDGMAEAMLIACYATRHF